MRMEEFPDEIAAVMAAILARGLHSSVLSAVKDGATRDAAHIGNYTCPSIRHPIQRNRLTHDCPYDDKNY
jgi:hypothetical protein